MFTWRDFSSKGGKMSPRDSKQFPKDNKDNDENLPGQSPSEYSRIQTLRQMWTTKMEKTL